MRPKIKKTKTVTNGKNGRDTTTGKFLPGNRCAVGNPYANRVALLRGAMLDAISTEDIEAIIKKLVEMAKRGSVAAAKLLLNRCFGRDELESRRDQLLTDDNHPFDPNESFTSDNGTWDHRFD